MTRKLVTSARDVLLPPESSRAAYRDLFNIAYNGLISIQRQLPEGKNTWKYNFNLRGLPCEITCRGSDLGVPHGIDNDVFLALTEEFIEQGCPTDNIIRITMYRLLQLALLCDDGRTRAVVRESLDRMRTATYFVKNLWRNHESNKWVTVTFNLLHDLSYETPEDEGKGSWAIVAQLPPAIAQSIREGYVKPIEASVLLQLNQPARAAYRVLDALRHDPENMHIKVYALNITLEQLSRHFNLRTERTEDVRRTLTAIHTQLLACGYLTQVSFEGRGKKQIVSYLFSQSLNRADPELVSLLCELGVSKPTSERLALEFPERIRDAVTLVRQTLQADGWKPRSVGAFAVDVVKTLPEGKYLVTPVKVNPSPSKLSSRREETQVELPTPLFPELSLLERTETALSTVRFVAGKRLNSEALSALRSALLEGTLLPEDVVRGLTAAKLQRRLEQEVQDLERRLTKVMG